MASTEHLELSSLIKSVHRRLRDDTEKLGETFAWSQHLQHKQNLKSYSEAMQNLATTYWQTNTTTRNTNEANQGKEHNRIDWTVRFCCDYFGAELVPLRYQRDREMHILSKISETINDVDVDDVWQFSENNRLKLLDVGSCYNPFSKYDQFDVTAIDIAPAANSEVIECDFLAVVVDKTEPVPSTRESSIQHFTIASYDIVVFSLLLEYMPTSGQRIVCCHKAYDILRPEGVLIVITPDSKHVGANARLMKNWRYTLATLGFNRIKIEKMEHITCMAFRKAISKSVAQRWGALHREDWMLDAIQIPQDFRESCDKEISNESYSNNCDDTKRLLSELPGSES